MRHASVWVLTALLLGGTACSRYSDYCAEEMDCEGGNDADIDACVERWSGNEDRTDAYDCAEEFDAWFECIEAESDCVTRSSGDESYTDCNEDYSDCECAEEHSDVEDCVEDASKHDPPDW